MRPTSAHIKDDEKWKVRSVCAGETDLRSADCVYILREQIILNKPLKIRGGSGLIKTGSAVIIRGATI